MRQIVGDDLILNNPPRSTYPHSWYGMLHAWRDMGTLCSDRRSNAMCRHGAWNGPCTSSMDKSKKKTKWGNVPATWRTPNKGESTKTKAQQVLFLLSCLIQLLCSWAVLFHALVMLRRPPTIHWKAPPPSLWCMNTMTSCPTAPPRFPACKGVVHISHGVWSSNLPLHLTAKLIHFKFSYLITIYIMVL